MYCQLSFPKQYEGLAVPDVHKYWQATHSGRFIDWCFHRDTKLRTQLEQARSKVPLSGTPWCYEALPHALKLHPLKWPTTRICLHLFVHTSLSSWDSPLIPVLGNPQFHDATFKTLCDSGRYRTSHFLTDTAWPSISSLTCPLGPFGLDLWRALQLHHFLHSLLSPRDFSLTTLEEYCSENGVLPEDCSKMYRSHGSGRFSLFSSCFYHSSKNV